MLVGNHLFTGIYHIGRPDRCLGRMFRRVVHRGIPGGTRTVISGG